MTLLVPLVLLTSSLPDPGMPSFVPLMGTVGLFIGGLVAHLRGIPADERSRWTGTGTWVVSLLEASSGSRPMPWIGCRRRSYDRAMKTNDRTIYRTMTVVDYGLASLTMVSVVLGWPVVVPYVLLGVLLLVTGLERTALRRRR